MNNNNGSASSESIQSQEKCSYAESCDIFVESFDSLIDKIMSCNDAHFSTDLANMTRAEVLEIAAALVEAKAREVNGEVLAALLPQIRS